MLVKEMGKKYVIGAGEEGFLVLEMLKLNGINVDGLFDDAKKSNKAPIVTGSLTDLEKIITPSDELVVAIGNCKAREEITGRFSGYGLFSVIHDSAIISPSVKLEEGVIIHPGVIISGGGLYRKRSDTELRINNRTL